MTPMARFIGRRVLNLGKLSTLGASAASAAFSQCRPTLVPPVPRPTRSRDSKATTASVIALVLSPIDLPGWVPVLGQAADALVIVNVLDVFIKAAPRHVVEEHIRALGLQNKLKV